MSEDLRPANDKERRLIRDALNAECTMTLPDHVLDRFIDIGQIMTLPRAHNIISAGTFDDNLYVIVEGVMRTWYQDGNQEVTQAFGLPGTVAFSNHCYYAGKPSTLNYEACTASTLLRVRKADFDALLEAEPLFALWNLRVARCQLYHYELKRQVYRGTARERYEALIRHRPEIIRGVSLRIIASYLRITPEYLSHLRRRLR